MQVADKIKLLTPAELVELLDNKVTEQTLAQWRYRGNKGPKWSKIGGSVFYRRTDVDAWLKASERTPVVT